VTCALLAAEGFTGDEQSLEGPYGLLSAIGPVNEKILANLGKDLGREYDLSKHGIKVKNIAAGARTHAPVEAMLRLIKKTPIACADVESIECDVHPYPLLRLIPKRGHEGRFSMAYCLGVVLLLGRLDPTDFSDDMVHDPRLQKLVSSVRHKPGSKVLAVNLKNGATKKETIEAASDMRDWDQVANKFIRCVRDSLTDKQQASLLDQVGHLEAVPSVRSMTESLRGRTKD
jgi:2-methylcitrate dehydratase PrpD